MPYSVMIWLTGPHDEPPRTGAKEGGEASRSAAGVTKGPVFTHFSYGFYESRNDLDEVLSNLSEQLKTGVVRVVHGSRTFLVPASRIHYVVADEVTRPVDD